MCGVWYNNDGHLFNYVDSRCSNRVELYAFGFAVVRVVCASRADDHCTADFLMLNDMQESLVKIRRSESSAIRHTRARNGLSSADRAIDQHSCRSLRCAAARLTRKRQIPASNDQYCRS